MITIILILFLVGFLFGTLQNKEYINLVKYFSQKYPSRAKPYLITNISLIKNLPMWMRFRKNFLYTILFSRKIELDKKLSAMVLRFRIYWSAVIIIVLVIFYLFFRFLF